MMPSKQCITDYMAKPVTMTEYIRPSMGKQRKIRETNPEASVHIVPRVISHFPLINRGKVYKPGKKKGY